MLMAEYGRRSGSSLKDPAHDSVYREGALCTKPGGTAGMNIQPVPAETAIGTGFSNAISRQVGWYCPLKM